MAALYANFARSSLAGSLTNVATSFTVATGQGALFPSPTGSDYAWITLDNGTTREIVKLTSRAGDVFTVVRAQQGTAAAAFAAATTVELRLISEDLAPAYGIMYAFANGYLF